MSERELILGRVREALRQPTERQPTVAHTGFEKWLPPAGASFDDSVALFRANCEALRADFHLFDSEAALQAALQEISRNEQWEKIAVHAPVALLAQRLGLPVLQTDGGYHPEELERCDAGLTECDALIAQTGTVLLTSRSAGGRALSALPPHHVVLARRDQLLPDLPAAFALLQKKYAADYPSFISFVTGPSRTGDIERILVLGAHGPRKLTILCR